MRILPGLLGIHTGCQIGSGIEARSALGKKYWHEERIGNTMISVFVFTDPGADLYSLQSFSPNTS